MLLQLFTAFGYCALVAFLCTYILWIFYLAVMNLSQAKNKGTLSKVAKFFGTPVLFIGLLVDLLCNILLSVVFLDIPRELTVTARLKRYSKGSGWRKSAALRLADDMLDDFDPSGKHI